MRSLDPSEGLRDALRHINACQEQSDEPIIGLELRVSHPVEQAKDDEPATSHPVTLLAHGDCNGNGWAVLCRAASAAYSAAYSATYSATRGSGTGKRMPPPQLDAASLSEIVCHRGLSVVSPTSDAAASILLGPASDVGTAIARGSLPEARILLLDWGMLFPGLVALEVAQGPHTVALSESASIAALTVTLAHECGIPVVIGSSAETSARAPEENPESSQLIPPVNAPQPRAMNRWLTSPTRVTDRARNLISLLPLPADLAQKLLQDTEELALRWSARPESGLGAKSISYSPSEISDEASTVGSQVSRILRAARIHHDASDSSAEPTFMVETGRREDICRAILESFGADRVAWLSNNHNPTSEKQARLSLACGDQLQLAVSDAEISSRLPIENSVLGLPLTRFNSGDASALRMTILTFRDSHSVSLIAHTIREIERVHGGGAAEAAGLPIGARYINRQGVIDIAAVPLPDGESETSHAALSERRKAWLKAHFPAPFLAAELEYSTVRKNTARKNTARKNTAQHNTAEHNTALHNDYEIRAEAHKLGIPILPVDVNESVSHHFVDALRPRIRRRAEPGDYGIRLSLARVPDIPVTEIERVANCQPYDSVNDFLTRAAPSKKTIRNLAMLGALDSLFPGLSRGAVIAEMRSRIAVSHKLTADRELILDLDLDGNSAVNRDSTATDSRHADSRHADSGHSVDPQNHAITVYAPLLRRLGTTPATKLSQLPDGSRVTVAGMRVPAQTPSLSSEERVIFISLEDETGCTNSAFFEDAQKTCGSLLFGTRHMAIEGTVHRSEEMGLVLRAEKAHDLAALSYS